MANQIDIRRPLDANGNVVPGAEAYFYQSGTTTPVTVYSDTDLTSAHSVPLDADAAGVFPQVFFDGAVNIRLQVTQPDAGADLPGYPLDPAPVSSTSSSGASQITFSPTTEVPADNVQSAIQINGAARENRSSAVKTLLASADAGEIRSSINVAVVIDEDDFSTDSPNRPPSQQSVKAYIANMFYVSPVQTVTSAGTLTLAHGLGSMPKFVQPRIKFQNAVHGYSVGDEIIVEDHRNADALNNQGVSLQLDATNITVVYGNDTNVFKILDTSGVRQTVTNTDIKLIIYAMA
jgi:hypothetical protein